MGRPKEKIGKQKLYFLSEEEILISKKIGNLSFKSESEFVGFLLRDYYYKDNYEDNLKQIDKEMAHEKENISKSQKAIEKLEQDKQGLLNLKKYKESDINQEIAREREKIIIIMVKQINLNKLKEAQDVALRFAKRFKTSPENLLIEAKERFEKEVKKINSINDLASVIREEGIEKGEQLSEKLGEELSENPMELLNEARRKIVEGN